MCCESSGTNKFRQPADYEHDCQLGNIVASCFTCRMPLNDVDVCKPYCTWCGKIWDTCRLQLGKD